jgi:methylated-DNA-[protein]-cysteine S-methyltransferase
MIPDPTAPPTHATDPTGPPADPWEDRLRAWSPATSPPRLAPTDVSYVVDDVGLGPMLFAVGDDGRLLATTFARDSAVEEALLRRIAATVSPRVLRTARPTDDARHQLEQFLAGRRTRFDLRVDLTLSAPFQREVLVALSDVAYGQRTTYGALARALGRPRASRAVGAALGANPLCVVLPCHRVVASTGALTGYAGGLEAKRRLLDLEASAAPGTRDPATP